MIEETFCREDSDSLDSSQLSTTLTIGEMTMSAKQSEVGNSLPFENSAVSTTAPDPFDPASLRISPENSGVSIRKIITNIPCQKPSKQAFVRTRSGDEWRLDALIVEDSETRDYYVVSPSLHEHLLQDSFPARLTLAVTRSGDPFLWLQKLPGSDGRSNRWNDSALVACQHAETKWVRVISNMSAGHYDVHIAEGINVEPQWPDLSFKEILRLCFKDRFIDSLDHPFLKRLRGEV